MRPTLCIAFRSVDWETRRIHPSVDLAKPVSRPYERDYSQYCGWPYYWGPEMTGVWGLGAHPYPVGASSTKSELGYTDQWNNDPHLRSVKQVVGLPAR